MALRKPPNNTGNGSACPRAKGLAWWLRMFGLFIGLFTLEQNVEALLYMAGMQPDRGTIGLVSTPVDTPEFGSGFVKVLEVIPSQPLATAGVVGGDHLRFDRPIDRLRAVHVGEKIGFIHDHLGRRAHRNVVAVRDDYDIKVKSNFDLYVVSYINILTGISLLIFGCFMIWKGKSMAPIFLGLNLVGFAALGETLQFWESRTETYYFFDCILALVQFFWIFSLPAFAMHFYAETIGPISRRHWQWLWVLAGLLAMSTIDARHQYWTATQLTFVDGRIFGLFITLATYLAAIGYMVAGWRRSASETQKRYALLLIALGFLIVSAAVSSIVYLAFGNTNLLASRLAFPAQLVKSLLAPALLTHAIFRDRVFDIGFAVNRTLIYGVISFGLLVVFGLIEWGSEKLLPHESLEASAAVSAGVALTIFVVFHRIRDFVEHVVERLLFRSWHDNEARLRRFVKEAAFIGKAEALMAASVAACARFAGGADCALYLREGDDYVRAHGKLAGAASRFDGDEALVVAMRTHSQPLEPAFGLYSGPSQKKAAFAMLPALALPMAHRARLDGFILLGAKPTEGSYRPDEIELLGWATHQIGLDLHALKVASLERDMSDLQIRLSQTQDLLLRAQVAEPK